MAAFDLNDFFQTGASEESPPTCVCGHPMSAFKPASFSLCHGCRGGMSSTKHAYECQTQSAAHRRPTGGTYRLCAACASGSKQPKPATNLSVEAAIAAAAAAVSRRRQGHANPVDYTLISYGTGGGGNRHQLMRRWLSTADKAEHYDQVHQLVNHASDATVLRLFDELQQLDMTQKRYVLHCLYDHYDAQRIPQFEQMTHVDDDDENDDIDDGKQHSHHDHLIAGTDTDVDDEKQLIAGNVNVSYHDDQDFLFKNEHLILQQEQQLTRIQQQQQQEPLNPFLAPENVAIEHNNNANGNKDDGDMTAFLQLLAGRPASPQSQTDHETEAEADAAADAISNGASSGVHRWEANAFQNICSDAATDGASSGVADSENALHFADMAVHAAAAGGDLNLADLEQLFECTIGANLTESLGNDLWWYRIFVLCQPADLQAITLTCTYFYHMKMVHELVHQRTINISSIPALVWKLSILQKFNVQQKLSASVMADIRLRFIPSMDWSHTLPFNYVQRQKRQCLQLPDTQQIFVEYRSPNPRNLSVGFLKAIRSVFAQLFANMRSAHFVELVNKTTEDFTWRLQSFNQIVACLPTVTRLRVPCWDHHLLNATANFTNGAAGAFRNIHYVHLTAMSLENFASFSPNHHVDYDGLRHSFGYLQRLKCLKGVICVFASNPSKKKDEMQSVADAVLAVLEATLDSLQYFIIGSRHSNAFHNPFVEYDVDKQTRASKHRHLHLGNDDGDGDDDEHDTNVLPMSYKLYDFGVAFSEKLTEIFWTEYENPSETEKEKQRALLKKQRQKSQMKRQLDMDAMAKLIASEMLAYTNPSTGASAAGAQNAAANDSGEDEDEDEDEDDSSNCSTNTVHFGDILSHLQESKNAESECEDAKESKNDSEEPEHKPLHQFQARLEKYRADQRFRPTRHRTSYLVMYNSQIYVEDDDAFGRIPLNVNDLGHWQCPFCTLFNAPFERRCKMCRKRKVKYIPENLLIEQQQNEWYDQNKASEVIQQESFWHCEMCNSLNENHRTNCKMCTYLHQ